MLQGAKFELPIRVLCVFGALDRGGAESMCMALFKMLDRDKIVFDFVKHTAETGAFEDEIESLGGKIYTCPRLSVTTYNSYIRWWDNHFKNHPEHKIIHGHMFTTSGLYFKVAHKYGRITVGHSHCASDKTTNRSYLEKLIRKKMRNMIPRYADFRLACSKKAGDFIFPDGNYIVLNNAIDTTKFLYDDALRKKTRESLGLGGELILGTVANLSEVKNPMGLINIFLAIKKINPETKLVWVGEGNQRSAIENRLNQENIKDCVTLLGMRDDVPSLLQSIDVFLLPSFYEGLPVSVIEAQAAGLPCFISDSVTKEVDITGLCHFLPIDQPDLWAHEILADHTVRKDMSDSIIAAGYDIRTTAKWLEEFYLNTVKDAYNEENQ